MFDIGDKITHPMHGAGIIEEIISQRVGGEVRDYFVMRMSCGAMTVMVPKDSCESIGVRNIISSDEADTLIASLKSITVDECPNWNRRYRENMMKIKSGDLRQVACVVKSLLAREKERGLSTGERKLLSSAKLILVSEIALAKDISVEQVENIIDKELI